MDSVNFCGTPYIMMFYVFGNNYYLYVCILVILRINTAPGIKKQHIQGRKMFIHCVIWFIVNAEASLQPIFPPTPLHPHSLGTVTHMVLHIAKSCGLYLLRSHNMSLYFRCFNKMFFFCLDEHRYHLRARKQKEGLQVHIMFSHKKRNKI